MKNLSMEPAELEEQAQRVGNFIPWYGTRVGQICNSQISSAVYFYEGEGGK